MRRQIQPTELAAQRALHAVAVEQFTFNLGRLERLAGHDIDGDGGTVIVNKVLYRTDEYSGLL